MRTIIITVAAFLLLSILMVLNHGYIRSTANELVRLSESLDFDDKEASRAILNEIDRLWRKSSVVFSLTVSFREIDHLGEVLLSLIYSLESPNETEFELYRALLLDAIDGVARLENFSVVNIL